MSNSKTVGYSNVLINTLENIPIAEIIEPHYPLRSQLNNIAELESSITEIGLLHPIIVCVELERFRIITGYRRFTACKNLGWKSITCYVIEVKDQKTAFEIALVENLQRSTLSLMEEAHAYKTYVNGFGWGGISELSTKIGKSISYVSRRIRLLEFH